jgi:hypothetical protein
MCAHYATFSFSVHIRAETETFCSPGTDCDMGLVDDVPRSRHANRPLRPGFCSKAAQAGTALPPRRRSASKSSAAPAYAYARLSFIAGVHSFPSPPLCHTSCFRRPRRPTTGRRVRPQQQVRHSPRAPSNVLTLSNKKGGEFPRLLFRKRLMFPRLLSQWPGLRF